MLAWLAAAFIEIAIIGAEIATRVVALSRWRSAPDHQRLTSISVGIGMGLNGVLTAVVPSYQTFLNRSFFSR
jgi:hypothetical protein